MGTPVSNHDGVFNRHVEHVEFKFGVPESKRSGGSDTDRKAGKISFNIFNSQPMHLLSKAIMYGGVGAIAVVCLPSAVVIAVPAMFATFIPLASLTVPVIPVVTGVAAALFIGEIISKRKELRYEFSLFYAWSQGQDWWTEITPDVVLGAIPLDDHLTRLYEKEGIGAMITLLEEFEMKPGLFTPADLNDQRGERLLINARDFQGVSVSEIDRCVKFIEQQAQANKKTYVHCKSGRGRSAVVVLSYLLKQQYNGQNLDFEAVYRVVHSFVKEKRPRINLNANQQAAVRAYYEQHVKGA